MRLIWIILGGAGGGVVGAIAGFALAMVIASFGPKRMDGTFGMREVLACVPLGAVIGLIAGAWLGARFG